MEKLMEYIDLHIHTTASDGSLSPTEVVRRARERRLKAIAITDHDTIDGCEEAMGAGRELGIEVISGVEISIDWPKGTMHMLGYFPRSFPARLNQDLQTLKDERISRNEKMLRRLQDLGVKITEKEILNASGGGQIGRPHFARVMLAKGYVSTMDEAFNRYLKKGAPAYVEKDRLSPERAIGMILQSEGVPVLAHPITLPEYHEKTLPALLSRLRGYGLAGIEVYYYLDAETNFDYLLDLASRYDLLVTGGTDFHGENLDAIEIGIGRGNLRIPYSLLEKLKKNV